MARDEAPPFARGETWFNGSPKDPALGDPVNMCGKEYVFEVNAQDQVTGYPITEDVTGRRVRVRVAQNKSGQALLPKRIARFHLATGVPLATECDGYTFQASDYPAGVVDEFLPAAGVPNGDLFYLVVEGPTIVKSASASFAGVATGERLEVAFGTGALTADAGRVNKYAGSPTLTDYAERVGRADATVAATNDADVPAVVNFLQLQ